MSLRIRSTALAATAAGALAVVFGAPAVAAAVVPITGSPISVYVGDLGQLQAHRDGDSTNIFLEGSDVGTGIFTQGPPRFIGGTNADTGRSGGFVEILTPSTSPAWSHYQALRFDSADGNNVWSKVENAAANGPVNSFDDTVL